MAQPFTVAGDRITALACRLAGEALKTWRGAALRQRRVAHGRVDVAAALPRRLASGGLRSFDRPMPRIVTEATFEEWIEFIFARPVSQPAWYWERDADEWLAMPERTAELMAETFVRSGEVLEPYDDAQVNQGLWMLASESQSFAYTLLRDEVPWPKRAAALEGIFTLYRDCFGARCTNHLSHLDVPAGNPAASPLNAICYMWWDIFPATAEPGAPARRERDQLVLSVLERTLDLPHDACREAALHGLGHWERAYPERVHDAIDRFIWGNRKIPCALRNYAYAARHGDVL